MKKNHGNMSIHNMFLSYVLYNTYTWDNNMSKNSRNNYECTVLIYIINSPSTKGSLLVVVIINLLDTKPKKVHVECCHIGNACPISITGIT